jgi:hypothetical protein
MAGGAVYGMSKSALVGLTKGMARDLGPPLHYGQQCSAGPRGHRYEPG